MNCPKCGADCGVLATSCNNCGWNITPLDKEFRAAQFQSIRRNAKKEVIADIVAWHDAAEGYYDMCEKKKGEKSCAVCEWINELKKKHLGGQ